VPKRSVNPPALFDSRRHGFSQAVVASGRRTVYVSGQTAWTAERAIVGAGDLAEQARQALRNLSLALEAGGAGLQDVAALRIYVVDYTPDQAPAITAALQEFFPGPEKPASTWLGVAALANPDFLIEIEAVAILD
jgi:enamine deaminase RidA (YjgF/YER057c/UK114 family)